MPSSPLPPSPGHLPALDGVRGLAVLSVIAFHAKGALPGGYLGVDLFFVLSGFLITGILLREQEKNGRIDLGSFWIRRARRLLPAVLVLMPAIALYARVFATGDEISSLRRDALATLAYLANWRTIYAGKSYWEIFQAPSPLEHTWSLAIEEQFYLVWPLVVVFAGKRLRVVAIVLALASMAAALFLYDPERTTRVYMGSDTRAAAILFGAVLATLVPMGHSTRRPRLLDASSIVAFLALAYAWSTLDGQSPFLYRGGFWLTELAALVVITAAVTHGTILARVLAFRPLAFVGTISYGLYLWHWPIDCVLSPERVHLSALPLNALRIAVTFAIALVSFYVVEKPIRHRGVRHWSLVPAALAAVLVLLVGGTRARASSPITVFGATIPQDPRWPDQRSVKSDQLPPADRLKPSTTRILVLGDSVAQYLGEAMRIQQTSANVFVAQRGVGSCSIHESTPTIVNGQRVEGSSCATAWESDVAELHPDVTLLVLGGGFLGPRTCEPDWRQKYNDRLSFLVDRMHASGGQIVVTLVPYPGERWRVKNTVELVDCFNDELGKIATAHGLQTLDLKSHVCPTTDCLLISEGAPIRNDGLHFDGPGAAETARWTLNRIQALRRVD